MSIQFLCIHSYHTSQWCVVIIYDDWSTFSHPPCKTLCIRVLINIYYHNAKPISLES